MKNKLLKRVIALAAMASMLVIGPPVVVNAEKITTFPYVNNFDDCEEVKYTASFWAGEAANTGVWQFYADSDSENTIVDTLEITTDEAAPERGKVMKVNMQSTNERFVNYALGNGVSEGKYLIKFDIKAQNEQIIYFSMTGDAWWQCLKLQANTATVANGFNHAKDITTSYSYNEYNTVKVLVDLDNYEVTTCFNDVVGVATFPQSSIPGFKLQFNTDSGTTTRNDYMYVDNLEIRQVSGTVAPVLADGDGTEIGAYSPVADTLKLSLSGGDFFDKAPNATLIDLGANPVAVTNEEISVTPVLADGAVTYTLGESLIAGHRYKLVIDDVKSAWAQTLTKTEFEFVCSETSGKVTIAYEEDFSAVSADTLTAPATGASIYEGSKLLYRASTGSTEILEDASYTGGKALKMNSGTKMMYKFTDTRGLKSGDIEIEARIIQSTAYGSYALGNAYDNTSEGTTSLFQWSNAYKFLNYYQSTAGNNAVYSNAFTNTKANGEIVVKHKIDLDTTIFTVNINGTDYNSTSREATGTDPNGAPYTLVNYTGADDTTPLMDTGVAYFAIKADGDSTIVDYLKFKYTGDLPSVTKITFVDKNGEEAQYVSGTELYDAAAMKVYFNNAVDESKLSGITIDNGAQYTGSYDSENNVYTLSFTEDLADGVSYTASIPASAVVSSETGLTLSEDITGTFTTGVPPASVKITDAEGNELECIGAATINIVAENIISDDDKVVIVYAGYTGGRLAEMSFEEVDLTSDLSYTVTIKDLGSLTSIKAFVLEDLQSVEPLCKYKELGVMYQDDAGWVYEKNPASGYAYSFAVVPDTQYMTRFAPAAMDTLYDWIAANAEAKKMKWVFGVGDITDQSTDSQWYFAKRNIAKLDGVVPYSLVRGNHDTEASFVANLPYEEYAAKLGVEGSLNDNMLNTYQKFTVGDIKYMVVNLDFGMTDDEVDWANEVIAANPDYNVIVVTHAYLNHDGTVLDGEDDARPTIYNANHNDADVVWSELISKHENIVLVLSGHIHSDKLVVTKTEGVNGNIVTQMLVDSQETELDYCFNQEVTGLGLVAMLYFSEDGKMVDVEYYSTVKDAYFLAENQFSMELDMLDTASSGN